MISELNQGEKEKGEINSVHPRYLSSLKNGENGGKGGGACVLINGQTH